MAEKPQYWDNNYIQSSMSHYVSHCLGVSTYRVKSREQVRIDLENNFIIATKVAVLTKLTEVIKIKNTAAAK